MRVQGILPSGRIQRRNRYPHATSPEARRRHSDRHWAVYGCKAPSDPIERAAAFHVIKRFESNWGAPPHLVPIVKRRRRANSRHGWRKQHGLPLEGSSQAVVGSDDKKNDDDDDEEEDAMGAGFVRGGEKFGSVRKSKGGFFVFFLLK